MTKSLPAVISAGFPWSKGAGGARILHLTVSWSQVRENSERIMFLPSLPCPLQRTDAPHPGKARSHACAPFSPGQAGSRAASQTSPCIQAAESQTLKSSHSPSHMCIAYMTLPSWGESRWGLGTHLVQRVKKNNSPRSTCGGNYFSSVRWDSRVAQPLGCFGSWGL